MDTKERRTPVQDTCPAPGSVCRTHSWRPAPPKAAKIELEKPKSISRGVRKNFSDRFSLAEFRVAAHVARPRPCNRATASPSRRVGRQFLRFFAMQKDRRSLSTKNRPT